MTGKVNPVVAIVGRQNVGKSTLLNRLVGRRLAIVEDLPGTTRDRLKVDINERGRDITLIDTGGLEPSHGGAFAKEINSQIKTAIAEADVVLFVVDTQQGLMPPDDDMAALLRPVKNKVVLAANKADNFRLEMTAAEFGRLGLGEPIAISAYHGRGINELLDQVTARLPGDTAAAPPPEMPGIAIVGRPNVGKSMLLNCLLGEERVIVSAIPGTTRDAIDTYLDFQGRGVILIDTAGIKRRGRVGQGVDRYSVDRSLKAIERADIALLVLDATEIITDQDLHIAGFIQEAFKGIVIVVNKWDLAVDLKKEETSKFIRSRLKFFGHAPIVFTSARTGQGVPDILPQALAVYQERLKRVSTAELNSSMQQVIASHTPPHRGKKIMKFFYTTQADTNPPTFVFFVNDSGLMHFSYQRFLENSLRQNFGFQGTPIRLIFKNRGDKE